MKKAAVIIFLPEDTGFKAEMDSVSGSVRGYFAMERKGEDEYVYGDGRCEIDVNPVSGDLMLEKLNLIITPLIEQVRSGEQCMTE